MPKTLFTIDLDYWTICLKQDAASAIPFINRLINLAPLVYVIKYHHQIILNKLTPKGTEKVINIDYHNDLTTGPYYKDPMSEGDWGNYLPKSVTDFEWRFPKKLCLGWNYGVCHPASQKLSDYPINYRYKQGLSNLPFADINCLVICESPDWGVDALNKQILRGIGVFDFNGMMVMRQIK